MNDVAETALDLSQLSCNDLDKIFIADGLPEELRQLAGMLYELTEPNSPYVPIEGTYLTKEWSVDVSPAVFAKVNEILG